MTTIPDEASERLKQLAAQVAIPELGDAVSAAIDIAVQLVAQNIEAAAIVNVAVLDPKATRSDAEPAIREMLAQLGVELPDVSSDDSRYELIRHGVGFWDLPVATLEGPFYWRLPSWDEQATVDRAIVQLLDRRDQITRLADRHPIEARIRAVARYANDDAILKQIDAAIADQESSRPVRLPTHLAGAARRAWLRDEDVPPDDELREERLLRDRAGTLALIGLAVDERGEPDGDHILVSLTPPLNQ